MSTEAATGSPPHLTLSNSGSDPDLDSDPRIVSLELRVDSIRETQDAMLRAIQTLTERLPVPPTIPHSRRPSTPLPMSPTPSAPPSLLRRPKAASPEVFDGERSKGRAFLTSCLLYLSLRSPEFANDQDRIQWILSYMKIGRAATFAQRILRAEMRTGIPSFPTLNDFYKTFETEFCPENETTHALMRLESEKYFQGRRSVNSYIDEFRELIDLAGLYDSTSVVLKFRRGLNPAIQDKIAESETRPENQDLHGWYEKARRIDENHRTNEAFNSGSSRRSAHPNSSTYSNSSTHFRSFPKAPSSAPPPDGRHHTKPEPPCGLCGIPGHSSKTCYVKHKIRNMSAEDRQDWVASLLATDELDAEDGANSTSEGVIEDIATPEEDFTFRSE
jgi:Retrotransposon gag protein